MELSDRTCLCGHTFEHHSHDKYCVFVEEDAQEVCNCTKFTQANLSHIEEMYDEYFEVEE